MEYLTDLVSKLRIIIYVWLTTLSEMARWEQRWFKVQVPWPWDTDISEDDLGVGRAGGEGRIWAKQGRGKVPLVVRVGQWGGGGGQWGGGGHRTGAKH